MILTNLDNFLQKKAHYQTNPTMPVHGLQKVKTSVHFTDVTLQFLEYPRKPGYKTHIFKSRCTGVFVINHTKYTDLGK